MMLLLTLTLVIKSLPSYIYNYGLYYKQVSSKTVAKARHHCKVNGSGCAVIDKLIITQV